MYSTFTALEIAQRALHTQQAALSVTGHNISNANTTGYSRQIPEITTANPLTFNGAGRQITMGTGSVMNAVKRARDSYIDNQYRWETSKYTYWEETQNSLQMIEGVVNEPTDYSLSNDLNEFWNAWSKLADNTQNTGARDVLNERAATLIDSFHRIDRQITDLEHDLNENVRVLAGQINDYAEQIAELNRQIKSAEIARNNPNDLEDQRDLLIDKIAELLPVKVEKVKDTSFSDRDVFELKLSIGEHVLINDQEITSLELSQDGDEKWQVDLPGLEDKMGRLSAIIELRDNYLSQQRTEYDNLAQSIAEIVNTIHRTGQGLEAITTGRDFFVDLSGEGITAKTIGVNPEIIADSKKIATGKINNPPSLEVGDSKVALDIASLGQGFSQTVRDTYFGGNNPLNGASSIGDYYGAIVAELGVDVQQAERMAEGQSVLVNHMANQRESYSGVSLDEEMANLIKYQKSYSAAARLVTILDSMFEQILGMGVTR